MKITKRKLGNSIKLFASIFIMGLMFTGCAPSTKLENEEVTQKVKEFPAPNQGNAGVYVFRDSYFYGAGWPKDIWINEKCLGKSVLQVFFHTEVLGNQEHTITTQSEFSPNSLKIFMETGKNYFIRQYIKPGVFILGANLEVIDELEAKEAIKNLPLAVNGICDNETPPK